MDGGHGTWSTMALSPSFPPPAPARFRHFATTRPISRSKDLRLPENHREFREVVKHSPQASTQTN